MPVYAQLTSGSCVLLGFVDGSTSVLSSDAVSKRNNSIVPDASLNMLSICDPV